MSLFPNESHSFPDLEGAEVNPNDNEALPPEQTISFEYPDEPQANSPPQRATPVMPVMPTVPDQLEQLAQTGSEHVEVEWAEPPREIREDNINSTACNSMAAKRRWAKLLRFLIFEMIAVSALLIFAKLGVEERFSGNSLTYLYGTVTFIAAIAAALIPVIFYALPPRLPPAPPR